jgi:hypothetical protein
MPGLAATSIEYGLGMAIVLTLVLLVVDGVAVMPRRSGEADEGPPRSAARQSRTSGSRRLIVAVAAVASIVGIGLWFGSGLYQPLRAFGPATGSGSAYVGTEPATFGGLDDVDFASGAGAEIRFGFTLENSGDLPVTVTGLADPPWGVLAPIGQSGATAHRFQLDPHSRVGVLLVVPSCSSGPAAPTLAPGIVPTPLTALAARRKAGAIGWFATITLSYEILGLGHAATLQLPANVGMLGSGGGLCVGSP